MDGLVDSVTRLVLWTDGRQIFVTRVGLEITAVLLVVCAEGIVFLLGFLELYGVMVVRRRGRLLHFSCVDVELIQLHVLSFHAVKVGYIGSISSSSSRDPDHGRF